MNIMGWIALAAGAILLIIVAICLYERRSRRIKYEQATVPHVEWAEKVLAADTDRKKVSLEQPEHSAYIRHPLRYQTVVYRAQDEQRNANRRLQRLKAESEALKLYEDAASKTDLKERANAYQHLSYHLLDSTTSEHARQEAVTVANAYLVVLLESARSGDRSAFFELTDFVNPYIKYSVPYVILTQDRYKVPHDWDDMVARYHKAPSLDHFVLNRPREIPGELRLFAIQALNNESLVKAKFALAHYDSRGRFGDRWRQEIGVQLMTDLGKLIDRIHTERQLMFA